MQLLPSESCEFHTVHPILRWLPLKLAECLAEIMLEELAIPAKQGSQYTVAHLDSILSNNLVPSRDGGHLRTTLHWESDNHCRGRPKASCYPFDLACQVDFSGKNPQVHYTLYVILKMYDWFIA
jgi:hypothetical protein